ncbi:MAG: hypothetical protein CME65_00245 [Halobacteriovoraceae bacterium]|nr:hypothetical protein [Halobacteriovoraceae bacterium]
MPEKTYQILQHLNSKQLKLQDDKPIMRVYWFFILGFLLQSAYSFDRADVDLIDAYKLIENSPKSKVDDWKVDPEPFREDDLVFKNQNRDITNWSELDPYEWLSFKTWRKHREIKDKNKNWRQIFREATNREVVGRILKCIGLCQNFRGSRHSSVEHMSQILEGDEVITKANSGAWVILLDGTLIRMSSNTSISFNEVNISDNEVMYFVRHNYGYASYRARLDGEYLEQNRPESDLAFLPLKVLKANREYYAIQEYREFNDKERLQYSIVKNPGYVSQYYTLNREIQSNGKWIHRRDSRLFVYTANVSLEVLNSHLDLFYGIKNSSLFRRSLSDKNFTKKDNRLQKVTASFRGYLNSQEQVITDDSWYQTDKKGLELKSYKKDESLLNAAASFTNRVPAVWLARELWLKKYSQDVLKVQDNFEKFAVEYGYRLWDSKKPDELEKRLKFAKEYTRRTETTILNNMDLVFIDYPVESFSREYFKNLMKIHYNNMKKQYQFKQLLVREMTDTQYYLWTLRYAQEYLFSRSSQSISSKKRTY